jgi:hypothetical protein
MYEHELEPAGDREAEVALPTQVRVVCRSQWVLICWLATPRRQAVSMRSRSSSVSNAGSSPVVRDLVDLGETASGTAWAGALEPAGLAT